MNFLSRYPVFVWFFVIALLTSLGVSYYTYDNIFQKQKIDKIDQELKRIHLRMTQLQGTVNDFNRRNNYNAIHREVSRLSIDPTMDLILIVDEHRLIRYSSLIEYRNTPLEDIAEINEVILNRNQPNYYGSTELVKDGPTVIGVYPLENISDSVNPDAFFQSYLFARFDLSGQLEELRYRQQQEILHVIVIHFAILGGGFLLLYLSMRSRIRAIVRGIRRFSDGDYNTRIRLLGLDEFSKISNGFDIMAEKLQMQNRNLTSLTSQLKRQHAELELQEQDLRVTLNSIGDAVIATDSYGNITRMNPVAQSLTGWTLEDASGKAITSIFRIIDASTRELIENPIEKVIKTGQTVYLSNNTTLISRDGKEYQISDSAAPIRNENNIIQGMVLIFNDVTEKYRLRKAVAESEQLLRSIMDNSPALISVISRDNYFTYVNQRFLKAFELAPDAVTGKRVADIFSSDIVRTISAYNERVLAEKNVLEIEEDFTHRDGIHNYSSIRFPLLDGAGVAYAVCCIYTDITDRKQQEQIMRRSQKMDALGKLTGGIAHDYNNMLGIVMGYSDLLIDSLNDNPDLQQYARQIRHASERGVNMNRKLLAFTRPQQSQDTIVNIARLLEEQRDMLTKVLTPRIRLNMELAEDLWTVRINGNDLEDAIVNMAINAMHAMENGGQLTIRTGNRQLDKQNAGILHLDPGEYVLLEVIDTGIGMDKETQERMFDPFFSTKGEQGVGLGLSQVYGLVETNNGAIKVVSEPDQGTHISIYLPRDHAVEESPVRHTNASTEDLSGDQTILIVDDEPGLRNLISEVLIQHGYTALVAENGMQALNMLEQHDIDILFSDVIMPDMDGYQLASIVQEKYPDIKIQLASGYNEKARSEAVSAELYKNILNKPYSTYELLRRIRQLSVSTHADN